MTFSFPADCSTPRRRIEFCYRAERLTLLLHNKMGRWYRVTYAVTKRDEMQARVDVDPEDEEAQELLVEFQALVEANPPITQAQYDAAFPSGIFDRIKMRYPFAPALTEAQWDDFQDNVYDKLDNKLQEAITENLDLMRGASEFMPDLEDIHGAL